MFQIKIVFCFRTTHGMSSTTYDYYYIEYSFKGLFRRPIWNRLTEFKEAPMDRPEESGWREVCEHMEYAENIAKSIQSKEDLDSYYAKERAKEAKWLEQYEKYVTLQKPIIIMKVITR